MHLAPVVDPRHAKHVYALRLHKPLYYLCSLKLRVLIVDILYGDEHFLNRLQKLRLIAVFPLKAFQYVFNFHGRFALDDKLSC